MEAKHKIFSPTIPVLYFHHESWSTKLEPSRFQVRKGWAYVLFTIACYMVKHIQCLQKKLPLQGLSFCIRNWSVIQDASMPRIEWGPYYTCSTRNFRSISATDGGKKSVRLKIHKVKCLLDFKWRIRDSIFCFHQTLIFLCPGGENIHYYWLFSEVYSMEYKQDNCNLWVFPVSQ